MTPDANSNDYRCKHGPLTSKPGENQADVCRSRGWGPGTRLVGDEGHGPTVIEITALGELIVLAKTISHNGDTKHAYREHLWTLSCRDWQLVVES